MRAVVFDIGGVLEITPDLGFEKKWGQKLNLKSGELNDRVGNAWEGGSTGAISIEQVHNNIGEIKK